VSSDKENEAGNPQPPRPDGTPGSRMKRERQVRAFDPYDSARTLEGERAIEVFRRRRSPGEAELPRERDKRQKLEIEGESPPNRGGENPGFDPYDTMARRTGRRRPRNS